MKMFLIVFAILGLLAIHSQARSPKFSNPETISTQSNMVSLLQLNSN